MQSLLGTLAVVNLSARGDRGEIADRITDPAFDVPTTVARSANRRYLPNARFGIPSPETADYTVVSIPRS